MSWLVTLLALACALIGAGVVIVGVATLLFVRDGETPAHSIDFALAVAVMGVGVVVFSMGVLLHRVDALVRRIDRARAGEPS